MSTVAFAPRRTRSGLIAGLRDLALVAVTAGWTAAFVSYRLGDLNTSSHRLAQLVLYGWPVALVAAAAVPRVRSRIRTITAVWAVLVLAAMLLMPLLTKSSIDALAVPVVAIAVIVATRWPALMVGLGLAISGSFGDLEAYLHMPTQKVLNVVLGGLILSVGVLGFTRRHRAVLPRPLILLLAAYLFITIVMVPLAPQRTIALHDFSTTALYLIVALVIAHAGWRDETYQRMAKLALVAALLVGAYATLRVAIGPSAQEALGNQSPYDYVNGHYRAIGSFHTPQDLGFWTSVVFPFPLAWALAARGRWRLVGALACVLLAVGMYGSGVRIALVAAGAGLIATFLLYHLARGFPGLRVGVTVAVAVAAVATGAVLFASVHSTSPTHSYTALLHPSRDVSVIHRETKWSEAFRELHGHPFGFGMGSAYYLGSGQRAPTNIGVDQIDNGYLFVALEQGLTIMGLFIAGLLAVLFELGRGSIRTRDRSSALIGIGAAGVLVAVLISAIAEVPGQTPRLLAPCLIIGIGLSQFTARRRSPGAKQRYA